MANPFLVLGGIAISVATAAFGILQVPGWVAAAQDAAAINDIAQVTAAQNIALAERGTYAGSVTHLGEVSSAKFTASSGVRTYTAADLTGKHQLTVARSASGTYFARTSESADIGRGDTSENAVVASGATVSGPVNARVTAEGVSLPQPGDLSSVLYRNLFLNPGAVSGHGFSFYAGGTGNASEQTVEESKWSHSGSAVRMRWTAAAVPDTGDLGVGAAGGMTEAGKVYTLSYRVASNSARVMTAPTVYFGQGNAVAHARSPDVRLEPLVPAAVFITFTLTEAQAAGQMNEVKSVQRLLAKQPGDYLEVSDVMLYEGSYNPDMPWFSGAQAPDGFDAGWVGTPNQSASYAFD